MTIIMIINKIYKIFFQFIKMGFRQPLNGLNYLVVLILSGSSSILPKVPAYFQHDGASKPRIAASPAKGESASGGKGWSQALKRNPNAQLI